jgi:hypothetical protein
MVERKGLESNVQSVLLNASENDCFSLDAITIPSSNANENEENLRLGFDPSNIVKGPPVYVRKQVYYQAYASTTFSIQQATNIIDWIGQKSDSDDCLPFAIKLIENSEIISIAEDNGEFGCGNILAKCLKKLDGYNVLVCVSRKVKGCFVTDMIACTQKHHMIKDAAEIAIELLHKQLTGLDLVHKDDEVPLIGERAQIERTGKINEGTAGIQPPTLDSAKKRMKKKPVVAKR